MAEKYDYRSKVRKDIDPSEVIPTRKSSGVKLSLPGGMREPKSRSSDLADTLAMFEKMSSKKEVTAKGGKWIQSAIKKPGALRKSMGVKAGETIPAKKLAKAAQAPGKMGQRARLAQTLRKMKK